MITVNGRQVPLNRPMTAADYLEENGYRADRVAVERNGEILPRAAWAAARLEDGDRLEIVSFVGGG